MKRETFEIFAFVVFSFILMSPLLCSATNTYDIIIVRGDMPTDYVVASIYASTKKIPLVLVDPDSIQSHIRSELIGYRNGGYQRLLIVGGESAISGNVESDMRSMGFIVNRLWDWNRYGTAARVSIDLWGSADQVVITNGEDYGGFIIAQKLALEKGVPILFIKNSTIPTETIDAINRLGAKSAILISIDPEALNALKSLGISAETVETMPPSGTPGNEIENKPDFLFYATLVLLLAAIILLSAKLIKRRKVPVLILTEDEEKLIEIFRIHGKTEQNKIAKLTDFSRPRISRMLQSLEQRGVIEREKFKKTYRIKLRHKIT